METRSSSIDWRRWLIGSFSWRRLARSVVEVYIAVLVFAWFFADRLIFQPPPPTYADDPHVLKIPTRAGGHVSARYLPHPTATFTLLHSHGNGEDLGGVASALEEWRGDGFSVIGYDYRGYGTSGGRPSTRAAEEDVLAVYDYAVRELGIPENRIIAHGRSVGAALAIHLAAERPVAGLVIESGFLTAFRVRTVVPIAPFDRFRNDRRLSRVTCPVLVLHGLADHVIPPWHGRRLFEIARGPKIAGWVENAGHDDLRYWADDRYDAWLGELKSLAEQHAAAAATP